MKSMKTKSLSVVLTVFCLMALPRPVHTCVGRLLVIAVGHSADQRIMGSMLSVLINERTGTMVNVLEMGNIDKCHEAVLKGKANIFINYLAVGQVTTGGSANVDDPQKTYTLVRQGYGEKYGMVWLKPFGFQGPLNLNLKEKKTPPSLAVPVSTKDVLRKFPVLDRVINKLAGRIDNQTINDLKRKANGGDVKQVVTEFLKIQKLI